MPCQDTFTFGRVIASYIMYGGSEIIEGLGNVQLGFAGDFQTAASNPALNILFNDNRDYYNLWGTASGLASLGLTYAASKFPVRPVQEFVPTSQTTNKSKPLEIPEGAEPWDGKFVLNERGDKHLTAIEGFGKKRTGIKG